MLGLAHEFYLFLDGFLRLGLRLRKHHLLDNFGKAKALGKRACLTWTCVWSRRKLQACANVRFAQNLR